MTLRLNWVNMVSMSSDKNLIQSGPFQNAHNNNKKKLIYSKQTRMSALRRLKWLTICGLSQKVSLIYQFS